jgi:leucyl-tRNA synthetase
MAEPLPIYNPAEIEPRWQQRWEAEGLYHSDIDPQRKKFYALTMLPYPSGDLHIGHWYAMAPSDARARFKRMNGFNVMFPLGFDAFGLPAENAAIKNNIHPKKWTYANIARMRQQLKSMGAMIDWRREAVSADPEYYRWTQWFFIQLFNNDLAYRKLSPVDWCPHCNTTLAREQVWGDDRHCERCGTPVIKKSLDQWFFRITRYAEDLLNYDGIDWPERVRTLQTNWIGRSEGASVTFHTVQGDPLEVFTTRPDTLFGATFMVLAPEHPLVAKLTTPEQKAAVDEYIQQASRQTDIQREAADKEKSGVFTGGYAINPINGKQIPVWIADYVLMTYGTGAIMAVPAHDDRDFAFALKFGLPVIPVIDRPDGMSKSIVFPASVCPGFDAELTSAGIAFTRTEFNGLGEALLVTLTREQVDGYVTLMQRYLVPGNWNEIIGSRWLFVFSDELRELGSVEDDRAILAKCKVIYPPVSNNRTTMEMLSHASFYQDMLFHPAYGTMIHSGAFTGTPGDRAKQAVAAWLAERGQGKEAINYKLRDWLISRQRYWGAPIPMVHCAKCGWQPVPDDQLPVLLPDDVEWLPTGESPLKLHPTWRFTTCPHCGGPAERETDTMDTFMCSSWYHLRYLSPKYAQGPFDPAEYAYWMPVDTYTGGVEHANMHLIYTRFFHKALRDMGITQGREPMMQLRNQGMVLGEDGEKMSKSRGNVVSPDDLVQAYGADAVRAFLMFFARWEQGAPWNRSGIDGTVRWLRRIWSLFQEGDEGPTSQPDPQAVRALRRKVHQTLRSVTRDFETFNFNTIVSALMELANEMGRLNPQVRGTPAWDEAVDLYLRMLAPVTPHISEEIWARLGKPYSIHLQAWPAVDDAAAAVDEITLVVQINGKLRDRMTVPVDIGADEAKAKALASEIVQKFLEGKPPRQVIYVPGRLINIVL